MRPGLISLGYLRTSEVVTVLSGEAARVLTVIVPGVAEPPLSRSDGSLTVRTPGGPVPLRPPYTMDRAVFGTHSVTDVLL
ncbi:hypothetical protein [Nonomuraea mesophila]|uniref:hypothetical protein n=1 Tax=Nonomuraea mesophila TaxID=2530382 RepID=UPI001FE8EF50|nr:hypothetical protein [Nonomuraea mesophila]